MVTLSSSHGHIESSAGEAKRGGPIKLHVKDDLTLTHLSLPLVTRSSRNIHKVPSAQPNRPLACV